jgi:hypothetical protein
MAAILQGGKRELSPQDTNYTITNFAADYTISCTESTAANIAATLTTLIRDLIRKGIVNGTVA